MELRESRIIGKCLLISLIHYKSLVHHHLRWVDSTIFPFVCGNFEGFGDGLYAGQNVFDGRFQSNPPGGD